MWRIKSVLGPHTSTHFPTSSPLPSPHPFPTRQRTSPLTPYTFPHPPHTSPLPTHLSLPPPTPQHISLHLPPHPNTFPYISPHTPHISSHSRDVRSRFFEIPTPILLQNYRILLQSCSGLRQKSKLQLLFSLLLLEEFLQTLQSQCYLNFKPVKFHARLLVFRDCARTDASQRA